MSKRVNWVPTKKINKQMVTELIRSCEESNHYTNGGPNLKRLETVTREKLKISDDKAVIVVDNGTSALHALVSGIHMYHDRSVQWATQSFTFPVSAQGPLSSAYIIDIDEDGGLDLNLVPEDCGGVIVTNIFGNVVDIDKYTKWAEENQKFLIFDNAATAYTFYNGFNSCNYGTGSIVSFHHTKPIGFGEGGAIIVDKIYEEMIRRVINFGIDNVKCLPWNRYGSNYKMSDIAAVYILQYFERFDEIVEHHRRIYREFKSRYPDIKMYPNFSDDDPFLSCFCLIDERFTQQFLEDVMNKGIYCRKYYNPLEKTQVAMSLYDRIICLPCTVDIETIDVFSAALDN